MSSKHEESSAVAASAAQVFKALEPLSPEDRARVLSSAAALYGIAAELPRQVTGPDESDNGSGDAKRKKMSLVELMQQKAPVTNSQRIAVFAYYRETFENKSNFSRADLLPYFATAKVSKPGNYGRDFAETVRDGWIHEEGPKSYLTNNGAQAVEAGFAGKAKPRGAPAAKR